MAKKTFYIPDEKLELFEKAESMAGEDGSISRVIVQAVEEFVKREEAREEGLEEVELLIGRCGGPREESEDLKKIKFIGKQIASFRSLHGQTGSRDDRGMDYSLYLTQKGKFLLYKDDWSRWQGEYSVSEYEIYESLKEVEAPEGLINEAKEELGEDPSIFLDI